MKKKVAIIGLGHIGKVLAVNFTKGKRPVLLANRNFNEAKSLAAELGPLAKPREISAAIKEADIIVLAIWFDAIKEVLNQYASDLRGKIIVDPSNPIAPDDKGGFVKILGENESAGQIVSGILPAGAKLVKALGTSEWSPSL